MSFSVEKWSPGTRAMAFAAFVVILAAFLAWILNDASPFNITAPSTAFGKFGYDAVRDRSGGKRPSEEDK